MDQKEYQSLILGALLHDIGKFMQRTEVETENFDFEYWKKELCPFRADHYTHLHVVWTKYFIDEICAYLPSGIKKSDLIQCCYHHKAPDSDFIRQADHLSAGMDRYPDETSGTNYKEVRLASIFDIVELKYKVTDEKGQFNTQWGYELSQLDLEKSCLFPNYDCGTLTRKMWKALWNSFLTEFKRIKEDKFKVYFLKLYYLLEKYTWCIPSATNVFPDISLFDHLKTTTALTGCLLNYKEGEQVDNIPFLIFSADISGIQNFIYKIASAQGVGGISKRLRGRSLYISLLPKILSRYVVFNLGLTIANINFCDGGNFEIILPYTREVLDFIRNFEIEVNKWLTKQFGGELGLVTAHISLSRKDILENFSEKKGRLAELLNLKKKKKQVFLFQQGDFFIDREKDEGGKITICRSCQINLIKKVDSPICSDCKRHKDIGGTLGNKSYIILASNRLISLPDHIGFSFGKFGWAYLISKSSAIPKGREDELYEIYVINKPDVTETTSFTFFGKTIPTAKVDGLELETEKVADSDEEDEKRGKVRKGQTLSFNTIADMSFGDKKLGILKMDMDHLGLIFSMGLKKNTDMTPERKELSSISRTFTLSRQLSYFFNGYINNICEEAFLEWKDSVDWKHKGDVSNIFYISYTGGDDLLIIGPASEIPKLAQKINQNFKEFTCHNPNLTVSAGIFVCKPKYPIAMAIKRADEALDISKGKGRNRITVMGETFVWDYENERSRFSRNNSFKMHVIEQEYVARKVDNRIKLIPETSVTFKQVLELAEDHLYRFLKDEKISHSFIHSLIIGHQKFYQSLWDEDDQKEYEEYNRMIIPYLVYTISRNIKDKEVKEKIWSKLITEGNAERYFRKIKFPARYALMKSRG